MNNQITVVNSQGQQIFVDCICYFLNTKDNKNYVFYTKNEVVQDGLIKMYVAEESTGVVLAIENDTWNDLKVVMQNIIKGNNNGNISFLPVNGPIKLGGEKVIALTQDNINVLKNGYNNDAKIVGSQSVISNKDLLTQNFGNTPVTEVPTIENSTNKQVDLESVAVNMNTTPVVDNVNNPTEVSSVAPTLNEPSFVVPEMPVVPNVDDSVNLSTTPANDTVNNSVDVSSVTPISNEPSFVVPEMPVVPNVDDSVNLSTTPANDTVNNSVDVSSVTPISNEPSFVVPEIPVVSNVDDSVNLGTAPVVEAVNNSAEISSVSPVATETKNDFEVSTAPNIFDVPSVDVVPTQTQVQNEVGSTNQPSDLNFNMFDISVKPEDVNINEKNSEPIVSPVESDNIENSIDANIIEAQIAIQKSNQKLFINLAENCKKMAELLERQLKTKSNESDLEKTASDLFGTNGVLDENKVLGLNKVA